MQTSVHPPYAASTGFAPATEAPPRKRTPLDIGSLVPPPPVWLQVKPEGWRTPLTDGQLAEAQLLVDVVASGTASKQAMARLAELDRIAFTNGQSLTDSLSAKSKNAAAEAQDPQRSCPTCATKAWFDMTPDARHRKAIATLLDIAGDQTRIRAFSVEWEALVHARAELIHLVAKSGVAQ